MNQAFYTGIVGIQTHQFGIDVVSDNIANINTVGFRASQVEFASLFETALGTTADPLANSVGAGSRVQAASMIESSGDLIESGISTNLAIEGEGWFGIANPQGKFYTRAGDFIFDASRDLVTPDGSYLLGTIGSNIANGILTQVLDSIPYSGVDKQVALNMPESLYYPAETTTEVFFTGNLGTEAVSYSMGAAVIDGEGNRNRLELLFTPASPQPASGTAWEITATVTTPDGNIVYDTRTATATFGPHGALTGTTLTGIDNNGSAVTISLGSGYDGLIAAANDDVGSFSSSANGFEGGELTGYEISQNADIIALFTNGRQSAVGRIAVYHFQNDQGLERVSGTLFQESQNSGAPLFYSNADGNAVPGALLRSSALENANIRLEVSLTELIVLQRAYDANAKSITTGDELIQKALSMDA